MLWVVWFAFLGGFTFLAASDFAIIKNAAWCAEIESHCLREWISALSGWAAVVAAVITAGFILRQVVEARRQTEFLLGDADPTLELYTTGENIGEMVIRIVNWNRRTIIIEDVRPHPGIAVDEFRSKISDPRVESMSRIVGRFAPFRMGGWLNRSAAPLVGKIFFNAFSDDGEEFADFRKIPVAVDVVVRIVGDRHERRTFTVTAPDHPTL